MDLSQFSPQKGKRVLVIGAAGLDFVGLIEQFPEPGTSGPARIRSSFGGVARNIAENLARLGQKVTLISIVGDDPTGNQLLAYTEATGVDVEACLILPGFHTASYLAIVNKDGGLHFALDDMRILSAIKPGYLREQIELFEDSCMVFFDANLPTPVIKTIIGMARRAHVPVCADPTSISLANKLLPFLSKLFLITPNTYEASKLIDRVISPSDPQDVLHAARTLVSQGVEIAVIPMAQFGVCYATSETNGHISAIRTTIQDPTGAGDAMTATIIFAIINGITLDDAIRLGVSAATLTLRSTGTVYPGLSLDILYDQLVI